MTSCITASQTVASAASQGVSVRESLSADPDTDRSPSSRFRFLMKPKPKPVRVLATPTVLRVQFLTCWYRRRSPAENDSPHAVAPAPFSEETDMKF